MAGLLAAVVLTAGCSEEPGSATSSPPPPTTVAPESRTTIFTHCGFWEIEFEGRRWTPTSIVRGSMPAGTDSMATPGVLQRAFEDLLVFTADSGLVVEFAPAPADLPPVPGCD